MGSLMKKPAMMRRSSNNQPYSEKSTSWLRKTMPDGSMAPRNDNIATRVSSC